MKSVKINSKNELGFNLGTNVINKSSKQDEEQGNSN